METIPAEMEYGIPKGIPVLDDAMREQLVELSHVKDASLYMSRTQVDYIYYNSTVLSGGQLIGQILIILEPVVM